MNGELECKSREFQNSVLIFILGVNFNVFINGSNAWFTYAERLIKFAVKATLGRNFENELGAWH